MGGLFVAAVASQAGVQIFSRQDILKKADEHRRNIVARTDEAARGAILSADGEVLAQSVTDYEFSVDYKNVPRTAAFFNELADAAGVSAIELQVGAQSKMGRLSYREYLPEDRRVLVEKVRRKWRADGVSLRKREIRTFPMGSAASGIVGLVRNGEGVAGLERGQERILEGRNGKREGLVDADGSFLPLRMTDASTERMDGKDIQLTIDSQLQRDAALEIRRAVETYHAVSGSAVIMDPLTGDILAMANWPAYDPSVNEEAKDYNPCIHAFYEPGSTFKVMTLAEALEKGLTSPSEVIHCTVRKTYKHSSISCDTSHGSHGDVNPEMAIAKSCNVAAATWALRIGRQDMYSLIDDSGLSGRPNLGFAKEASGLLDRKPGGPFHQLMNLGFGQALSATPVGLASAFSTLANDGVRMQPRLIRSIGGQEVPVKVAKRLFSSETARETMHLMEAVIGREEGTGHKLRIPGYRLAGKTGTAQKVGSGGGHIANFVGYVPAEKPKAVILVMVDAPKGAAYYGGTVAGPVFRELAKSVVRRYRIPPSVDAK